MVNNIAKIDEEITDELLLRVEADTFHCFANLLITMKQNYINGFEGVIKNIQTIEVKLGQMDKGLL